MGGPKCSLHPHPPHPVKAGVSRQFNERIQLNYHSGHEKRNKRRDGDLQEQLSGKLGFGVNRQVRLNLSRTHGLTCSTSVFCLSR